MSYNNIISIHLKKFNSIEEFQKLFADNGITNLDPNLVFDIKEKGYTKILLDKETQRVIAYVHKDNKKLIQFQMEYVSFLKNIKSIDISKEDPILSIDIILDKISEKGIKSLSKKEKMFLENNSN